MEKATAWIHISSAKYDKVWVKVNGKQTRYEAKSEGSGVVFQIPVDLNKQMKIMTHTMAMSSGKILNTRLILLFRKMQFRRHHPHQNRLLLRN